ncbi:Zn-ribbon domain-containing OB-fold protein [Martelella soudanensis]|uniref:Zn-ribbon domain-containing OB-fold protein n=1 Tax=unclassified Martelella TaxID=2629616 RepID=UPI0015DF41E5|nr:MULTISPECIES: Zn-ribbon domain-containing OB-fold protein [unclassified Martelella]
MSKIEVPTRVMREGLFEVNPPKLIGSRCKTCSVETFPARDFCPACGADEVEAPILLSPDGRVYSFTVIRQAPAGRKTPYSLAYVDLADGVRVLAQVDEDPELLRIGMPVTLKIRKVMQDGEVEVIGYAFEPDKKAEGEVDA